MVITLEDLRLSKLYAAAAAVVAIDAACVTAIAPAAAETPVAAPAMVRAEPRRFRLLWLFQTKKE